jgi:hypothetical protein
MRILNILEAIVSDLKFTSLKHSLNYINERQKGNHIPIHQLGIRKL